jgi:hypothetical protein
MHRLGRDVGEVGNRKRQQHLDERIAEETVDGDKHACEQYADRDAADRYEHELDRGVEERERARERRRHGKFVEHQARGVVHQALALEHGHDAARHAELRQDRGRRHRVRRRHDGAEREGHRPRHLRNEEPHGRGDHQHGDDHQANREQPDRPQVRLEVAPRGEQRRLIQDGRQHQHEQILGVELQLRQLRDEAERPAAEHQRDGIRQAGAARDPAQRHRAEQQEDDDLEDAHAARGRSSPS